MLAGVRFTPTRGATSGWHDSHDTLCAPLAPAAEGSQADGASVGTGTAVQMASGSLSHSLLMATTGKAPSLLTESYPL